VEVAGPPTFLAAVRSGEADLRAAGGVAQFTTREDGDVVVAVTLAEA
jgi:hypothetical protein